MKLGKFDMGTTRNIRNRRQGLWMLAWAYLLLFASPLTYAAPPAGTASASVPTAVGHPPRPKARPNDPRLRSSAALVLDASDSSVLYSKHSDVAVPIASLTKLMTALVVLDGKQSLDDPIKITADDRSNRK